MTDFIEGLEQDLVAAARRQAAGEAPRPVRPRGDGRRWRWSGRTLLVAAVLGSGVATATAATTIAVLRGSVIPAPAAQDVPREQTPVPSTGRVSALRVADPQAGVLPWTVRIARSSTGYLCSTVGQVRDGTFGLVGLDGRFRELAAGNADACGHEQRGQASLVGAKVLAGRHPEDVRTVVNGVGGPSLRRVELRTASGSRSADVAEDGAFVAVLRGYPEDVGLRVILTFAGGHRQREDFGRDPSLVLDPEGGPAWRAQGWMGSGDARSCVTFTWVRRQPRAPRAPAACGLLSVTEGSKVRRRGVFFAVRRLAGDTLAPISDSEYPAGGRWYRRPARTALWGQAGDDVRAVTILGLSEGPRRLSLARGGTLLAVLPPEVRPDALRIRITTKDGRTRTVRGDTNLVARPVPATPSGEPKP
ncbi:hypothetical protein [Patulibacter americanus]|uniref:hypothetical protein n=1 Tax=Patulibacter americanus TaxID=588672 RepID=UPI0003B5045D|nr:hypothetical protein [Patulibacter americanus]